MMNIQQSNSAFKTFVVCKIKHHKWEGYGTALVYPVFFFFNSNI